MFSDVLDFQDQGLIGKMIVLNHLQKSNMVNLAQDVGDCTFGRFLKGNQIVLQVIGPF